MAYSRGKKSQAIILLMTSDWDFNKVSKQTGIPEITLRTWGNEQREIEQFKGQESYKNNIKKMLIPEMLEEAIQKLLSMIPTEWTGQSWGVAAGILFDKWLLMQGESTSRNESIIRGMKDLSPDERNSILSEAERIIAEATSGRDSQGDS